MILGRASSSASRLPAQLSQTLMFIRTKKTNKGSHFPKQPKLRSYAPFIPQIRSPHDIRAPHPSSSASTAQPYEFQPFTPKTTSVPLENSELRLHHSPPSSAPSFTTGVVPILLQWLGGSPVTLSGEEVAPRRVRGGRKPRRPEDMVPAKEWSEETKKKIVQLRQAGHSQLYIVRKLGLPTIQKKAISFIAPQTHEAKVKQQDEEERKWLSTPYRRRVKLAVTKRRRDFW
ncbi:hypothetical protein DB88DRAFT_496831 [Papiliotrema laurentii]|uniref:Uncharacterized protein n=1 Tax=Papiliotrema laurentii TaxID=5418 RepID=A0AAD9CWH6_PAPLA|nr:hypothetical protein DB88DRAFT_496831 [Papiliotrema laurentii]